MSSTKSLNHPEPTNAPGEEVPVLNSKPYAQQYIPSGNDYNGENQPVKDRQYRDEQRFKPERKVNDIPVLILYLLTVVGYTVVSGLALWSFAQLSGLGGGLGDDTGSSTELNASTIYLLLLTAAFAIVLTLLYMILLRAFPKPILHISLLLTPIGALAAAIYYFIIKYYSGAIVYIVFVVAFVFIYAAYRKRIPMAAMFLEVVIDITNHHKMGVYGTALIAIVAQAALGVWFMFTLVATYIRWGDQECSTDSSGNVSCPIPTLIGLIVFEVFAYIWMSQVVANLAIATLAGGPFGSWYYFGPEGQGMPPHPTLSAFVRASTLSLGSIAFGSLIVVILEFIRMLLNAVQQDAAQDGNICLSILACCIGCFVSWIESLVEYFNKYAYIEIALYGKSYIAAAKDTWRLIKDRGVDAIINDSIVGMALTWGSFFIGALCVLFAFVYLKLTKPAYNADGAYTPAILLYAWFVGFQIAQSIASAIEAGISTIFVGLAENPGVLAQRAPALFELIRQNYPRVTDGVHGSV